MKKFIVGNILREVKNGRLNCNNSDNETFKDSNANGTYVKKIRRNNKTYPYASAQWQKFNLKQYAAMQGHKISPVHAISSKEAVSECNPYEYYDEDVMGFMRAKRGEGKKRRSNLMLSTLQAIGNTRLQSEFSNRKTDESSSILYSKEVYSTNMSSSFIFDVGQVGNFDIDDGKHNEAYRDYTTKELEKLKLEDKVKDGSISIDDNVKSKRIKDTIKGLQFMPTRTTMSNNLEDLSAKFMILAEYSIGNSVFNNIFEENKLKVDYLKEAIDENEQFRQSKIYIGCRSEFLEQDEKWLRDILEFEFGDDNRVILGGVGEMVDEFLKIVDPQ